MVLNAVLNKIARRAPQLNSVKRNYVTQNVPLTTHKIRIVGPHPLEAPNKILTLPYYFSIIVPATTKHYVIPLVIKVVARCYQVIVVA